MTNEDKFALQFGLKHSLPPRSLPLSTVKYHAEVFAQKLTGDITPVRNKIIQHFLTWWRDANLQCSQPKVKHWHSVLRALRSNDSIKILKPDKGAGVVIMDSTDYKRKLYDIINDTSKFTCLGDLSVNPIVKSENSIRYFLNKYIKRHVPSTTFDFIMPSGSQPGLLYGLAKIHKEAVPLRPVISMINTAQYNLAQYLNSLIIPHINTQYTCVSSSEFVQKLKLVPFRHELKMFSLDIVSLFTNVPLNETIDIATDVVYSSPHPPKFPRDCFKKLLQFATSGEFLFDGHFYRQVDGVSMGSPLGPVLANLFLGHLEQNWLQSAPQQLTFFTRYVDDTFILAPHNFDTDSFLTHMNSRHDSITFTIEHEHANTLAFLDVLVTRLMSSFSCTVHRKSTFTPLAMNFNSTVPRTWKKGLVICLLQRAYRVCSSWIHFDEEAKFLRRFFSTNAFPKKFFDLLLHRFITDRQNPLTQSRHTDHNHSKFIVIPYYGYCSLVLARHLKSFVTQQQLNLQFAFSTSKVASLFRLKDPVPLHLRSKVVYQFSCSRDVSTTYVGRTKRHLATRMREHRTQPSVVRTHLDVCPDCVANFDTCFKVLESAQTEFQLSLKEAIAIHEREPCLNKQLANHGASVYLRLFK